MNKIYIKKYFFNLVALLLFTSILFTGCKKVMGDAAENNIQSPPDLVTKIKSSVSGFVTDENEQAVSLANVQVGTAIITTDKYGFFEAKDVDVVKDAAFVTVTKAGYFKGIKTYIAEAGKPVFFRIKLLPKTNAGSINAATGGAVALANGLSITLPAGSVVNAATNAAYSGTVNVSAVWINPTASDLPGIMPGDLRGINTAGNTQLLTTYGMAAVELTGTGGELLQIAPGKKAIINLPIPAALTASAPTIIPLWYFDEAKGLWKEEGTAIKSGSNYVGEVSHFSFWNWDVPGNYVQFNATFIGGNNQPMQNVFVKISEVGNPSNKGYGITNASGYVSGAIPANAQLILEVFGSYYCPNPVYSQTIATTTSNISLGTITIAGGNSFATINGNVVNCLNAPVTNGSIIVQNGPFFSRFALSNTGSYSVNLLLCSNASAPVILIGDDETTHEQSIPLTHTVYFGNNAIPTLQACGISSVEFVHLTVNGNPQDYDVPRDRMTMYHSGVSDILIGYLPIPYVMFGSITFTGAGIGTGSTQTLTQLSIPQIIANLTFNNPPVNVHITEYGAVGQFVAGNFTGSFTGPPTNTQYNITCSFRIRRTF